MNISRSPSHFILPPTRNVSSRKPFNNVVQNGNFKTANLCNLILKSHVSKTVPQEYSTSSPVPKLLYSPNLSKISGIGTTIYSPYKCRNGEKQLYHCLSSRVRSPNTSVLREFSKSFRQSPNKSKKNFLLPSQYEIIVNNRKKIMKQYYKKKNLIKIKYEGILQSLNSEEESAIDFTIKRSGKENISRKLEDLRHDYALTKNLLQQQKLIEEEELVKKYKADTLTWESNCANI